MVKSEENKGKHRQYRGAKQGSARGRNRSHGSRSADTEASKNNPFYIQFKNHAAYLDRRHDKRERLVKLSRDITIESKRIIFLLHRIKQMPNDEDTCETIQTSAAELKGDRATDDAKTILQEAENRLNVLETTSWKQVADELVDEDDFLYLRSYTPGLQEYIEALSFYHHLKFDEMISWSQVQLRLSFQDLPPQADEQCTDNVEDDCHSMKEISSLEDRLENTSLEQSDTTQTENSLKVIVPQADFMLGIADLTGEVMRQAINSAGAGNTKTCFRLLTFLQEIHDGFVSLRRDSHREIPSKLRVLRASLKKVENVCYNINVRGSEVPKHLLGTYLGISGQLSDYNQSSKDFEGGTGGESYDFE